MKQGKSLTIPKSILITFLFLIPAFILNSCSDNPEEFTLGEDFIESQTSIRLIDTFTVNLSTVILDTMPTAGTEYIIIGNYDDESFGKITCNSYFRLEIPEEIDAETDDVYDSLYLVLRYDTYFVGDTTKTQKINVHQLTENIEIDDDEYLSSSSTFSYNPSPLGSITYTPRPNGETDTIAIKLSDELGLDLFNKLVNNSDIIEDSTQFIDYFHGLMLEADESYTGNVIGFKAGSGEIRMLLYSHSTSTIESYDIVHEFGFTETDKQFNYIKHDFSSTQLGSLTTQRYEIPSSSTGGLSYLMGGIGLAIRVDFPSLPGLLLFEDGKIADAKLLISPAVDSYMIESDLPSELILYHTDNLNRRNSRVTNSSDNYITSTLTFDDLYHESTAFEFDLTNYLTKELSDSYINTEDGLLISLDSPAVSSSLYRLIADAGSKSTKLIIYYLTY
jgi:hypothetical protein